MAGKPHKYTPEEREILVQKVFKSMALGVPCGRSCKAIDLDKQTFLDWALNDSSVGSRYADARHAMLDHWAEEVLDVSEEDVSYTDATGVTRRDGAGVQQQRLRIDSRKWLLSKLRPQTYGDRVTQEHVGAEGGPITLATVNLKGLSEEELVAMKAMLLKSSAPK